MARLIAIEWDAREARVAVARTRGPDITLEYAFAVDLVPRDPGQTFADVKVGERIAAALAARGIGRAETLVAVGRANIELRQMNLPRVPLDELPDMVRFQALRQFTTISEDWPLDFVQLDSGESDTLTVLAAAISTEMVRQIHQTCQAGDLTCKRLVLRPFAAASLRCRHEQGTAPPPRLMVDLLADEADLTVLVDERVVLMRTVRLSAAEEDGAQARALLGEIRRTVGAAQNQLTGQRIKKVILCGDGSDQTTLKAALETDLAYEVELFDPLHGLRLGPQLRQSRPEHAGRFAPLIGLLLDEAAGAAHAIDFLHPRKRPAPASQRRRNLLIGATAAVALIAAVGLVWLSLASLDEEIRQMTAESGELESLVKEADQHREDVTAIDQFLASDIDWLDELYRLSESLPAPEDVVLSQIRMNTRLPQGGQMDVEGYVREFDQIGELERALRAGGRRVYSDGGREDRRRETYRWYFQERVYIEPGDTARSGEPARAEQPAAKTASTAQGETAAYE